MDYQNRLVSRNDTNPPRDHTRERGLVSIIDTNLFLLLDANEGLVSFFKENLNRGLMGQILDYINEHPVFLNPTMFDVLKCKSKHAYKVVQKLKEKGVVTRTKIKIQPPISRYAGRRPRIHKLSYVELDGYRDFRVKEARKRYFKLFERSRNGTNQTVLDSKIVDLTIHLYASKARYGPMSPEPYEIVDYLKTLPETKGMDPIERFDYAKLARKKLREIKNWDRS